MENRFSATMAGTSLRPQQAKQPEPKKKGRISRPDETEEYQAHAVASAVSREAPAPQTESCFDFSRVRIHTDADAAASARELRASAYAAGSDIVFGAGRYAPDTLTGRNLLAHELTHVVQQSQTPSPDGLVVQRDGDGSAPQLDDTSAATVSVSLSGMTFTIENRTFHEGHTRTPGMRLILRRLLGPQYRPGLEEQVFAALARLNIAGINQLSEQNVAQRGQTVNGMFINIADANALVSVLEDDLHLTVSLTPAQRELLTLGLATKEAYQTLRTGNLIPHWLSEFIFAREMSQFAPLLRAYSQVTRTGNTASDTDRTAALQNILGAIGTVVGVIEAMRNDFSIGREFQNRSDNPLISSNRTGASAAYSILWKMNLDQAAALTEAPADTENAISLGHAIQLMAFLHTQQNLLAPALAADGHQNRVELLGRFARFILRVFGQSAAGDERLLDHPARANAPAWRANMTSSPQLQPPLYNAALETDHTFTMNLQFGDVFDAFAFYVYRWEFIRVPPPSPSQSSSQPLNLDQAAGQTPSLGSVLDVRLRRAYRYNAADVERLRGNLGSLAFGASPIDLVDLNNSLRVVGTVIRTLTQRATMPNNSAQIVFPSAGMYLVRCRAIPVLEGHEEVVHAPSVAFLPVVAEDPNVMATQQVRDMARTRFQAELRIAEIQALLSPSAPFPPTNPDDLRREMAELQAMLASPGQALTSRRDALDQQIANLTLRINLRHRIQEIEEQPEPSRNQAVLAELNRQLHIAGGDDSSEWQESRELSALQDQRSTVQDTIDRRELRQRGQNGLLETPMATFVGDLGQTLNLTLEMYDHGEVNGQREVYISDLTTPDSGDGMGHAPLNPSNPRAERVAAIKDAIKNVLETSSDYGRGRVAIRIDGDIVTVPIQAGTGRMLTEALESGVQVLSLAAIAAAPFTEGASLYLLLPLGAVGAIPSAYRLYNRYEAHTLRFDLATAMDVVNIVGGVVGLAQAATPLRMVRMARFLMIMGIGTDGAGILLMGAGVVEQIEALQGLPESERAARLLEILSGAMLQIGIQAGGAVAHARYGPHSGGGVRESGRSGETRIGTGDEPGFRLTDEARRAAATDTAPPPPPPHDTAASGDRTMSGSGRPPRDTPLPPPRESGTTRPPPPPPGSPEHLFGRLEQGIDRSLPPPRPASEVPNPPPRGDFRRNLRTADAAYHAYNEALAVSAGREVAIYHNPQTGEYAVRIGDEHGVSAPEGHGWDALVHYHPNPGNVLTYRLPAPADFQGLIFRYVREGVAVREFVEFDIPGVGRGRTEYGIDPANSAEPFYVRIHQPDGNSRTVRFAHDGAYHSYWGERTVYVEPGSPAYERMVQDISAYLRSREGSSSSTPSTPQGQTGGGTPPPPPQSQTMAGLGRRGAVTGPMQTGMGDLTPQGVALIRSRFRTVREGGRSVRLDTLSDQQIIERFPNQSNWLEAVTLAEARSDWLGRSTATDFVMANPNQTMRQVAERLQRAATAGRTGHSVHTPILEWSVWDFVREMLGQHDQTLEPAYNACENHSDPAVRRRWQEFKLSQGEGDMAGFFLGRVGDKKPDLVEVFLSRGEIAVTDVTFAYNDPIHNFKTAFYRTVLERLISVTVTGTEYRSPLRQTPIGP